MWRNFTKSVLELRRNFARGGATYRPDLHYMRGPGPKWQAKYGHLAPKAPSDAAPSGQTLLEMAERRA